MITKDQAMSFRLGTSIHCGDCKIIKGPRGGVKVKIERWRINGKCKTWKTKPEAFEIPLKAGLYLSAYLNDMNCKDFHTEEECSVLKEASRIATQKKEVTSE